LGVSEDWIFYVVAIGLVVVGIALLLGLMVRAASLAILVVAVWYGIVNGSFGAYFAHKKGCEYLLAIAALCGVVASHGPGAYKLEIKRKKG
jgi:uncharacterized membrane protein YphA (DoxX/SURF4 family)